MADAAVDANPAVEDSQNDAKIVESAEESSSTAPQNETKLSTAEDSTNTKDDVDSKTTEPSATSTAARVSPSPPPRPPKRARTAYFIFAESVRSQVQQDHQGVAAQAKAIGAKWQTLNDTEKDKFKQLALQEKEATAKAFQEYQEKYGSLLESTAISNNASDSNDLVFPVARIRKIAKLDPEVKTLSKEALQLVVKSAELALAKLGHESVKVARLENRRTLMASDVALVCSHREAFRFLKDDIKDLTKALLEQKNASNEADNTKSSKNQAMAEAASGTKPLTSYFGAAKK